MTEVPLDELGPVDYIVVEFPAGASSFTGEMAAELRALADSGTIRVIDVLILTKDADGTVEAAELSDIAELGELQAIEAELAELLAAEDVDNLAAAMEPGSTAGVLIWENLWATPFASAVRRSGGQLIANGRIPIQAIIASIEAEQVTTTQETDNAIETSTRGPGRRHPRAGREDRRGSRRRHPGEGGSPADLTSIHRSGGWNHYRGMCARMASAFHSRNDHVPVGLVNAPGAEGVLK